MGVFCCGLLLIDFVLESFAGFLGVGGGGYCRAYGDGAWAGGQNFVNIIESNSSYGNTGDAGSIKDFYGVG